MNEVEFLVKSRAGHGFPRLVSIESALHIQFANSCKGDGLLELSDFNAFASHRECNALYSQLYWTALHGELV